MSVEVEYVSGSLEHKKLRHLVCYDWHEKDKISFNSVMRREDYVVMLVDERNMMLKIGGMTLVSQRVL